MVFKNKLSKDTALFRLDYRRYASIPTLVIRLQGDRNRLAIICRSVPEVGCFILNRAVCVCVQFVLLQ